MTHLMDLRILTANIQEQNKRNFHSEEFSFDFQAALSSTGIPFKGQFIAFRRGGVDGVEGIKVEEALSTNNKSFVSKDMKIYIPKGMRVNPKIILHEHGHNLDNMVIGNQLHFWTEITLEDGSIFCFDNNHPGGILKHQFFANLEFSMETYLPESEPHPEAYSLLSQSDISARTVFRDNDHRYKTHEEIISSQHLLLVTADVSDFRHFIKNEANWQYRPAKTLSSFTHSFLDAMSISNIVDQPDELALHRSKCIQKSQAMKNQLLMLKNPKRAKVVDPLFFQEQTEAI